MDEIFAAYGSDNLDENTGSETPITSNSQSRNSKIQDSETTQADFNKIQNQEEKKLRVAFL
jgi:hypothetical protein